MSRLVELEGGVRGIVGLEWASVVDSAWKEKRKEIKAAKDSAVAFFQVESGDGETLINYGLADKQSVIGSRESKKDRPVSLAGMLALTNPSSSICVLERPEGDEGLVWFCISQNGQVVTGTDVIGTFEDIQPILETYRDLIEDGRFRIVGNAADMLDPTAEDLSASEALDRSQSAGASIDVGKEGMGVVGLTLVIGAIAAVSIAGYYIFLHDRGSGAPEMSAAEAAAMQRASAEKALKAKKEEIREGEELHGTLLIMNQFLLRYAPKQTEGWTLSKARCAGKVCTLEYQNKDWSAVELLSVQTEGVCDLAVTTNGEAALCTAEYEAATLKESIPQKGGWLLERAAISEIRRRLMEIASHSESSSFNLNSPKNINIPGSQFLQDEPGLAEVELTLNTGLTDLDETAAFLGDGKPIVLTEAVYNLEDGNVEIKAKFFVEGE